MSQHIVEAFTELAPRYERTMDRELRFMWGLSYPDFVDLLVGAVEIHEGQRILDVATGTANIPLGVVARNGNHVQVVGLDLTPHMLRTGARSIRQRATGAPIDLVCASAMNLALADGAVDVVMCGLAMHHLDVSRTLSEIARVLGEGGQFILGVVSVPLLWRTWWGKHLVEGVIRAVYLLTHGGPRAKAEAEAIYNLHTESEWRAILPAHGLEVVAIEEIPSRFRWGPTALVVKAQLAKPSQVSRLPDTPQFQSREESKRGNGNRSVQTRSL